MWFDTLDEAKSFTRHCNEPAEIHDDEGALIITYDPAREGTWWVMSQESPLGAERLLIVRYLEARAKTLPEPTQSAVLGIAREVLRGDHIEVPVTDPSKDT
jgi:hypothetical protein